MAFVGREVDDDAALGAVVELERWVHRQVAAQDPHELAGRVAGGRLHLHDVGAPVGEDAAGRRAGDPHAELDHADAFERSGHGLLLARRALRSGPYTPPVGSLRVAGSLAGTLATLPPIDILVVCTGNTCRSPMAEALLRDELAKLGIDARVHSAGTLAWKGGASDGAQAAMAERAIDLSAHRSRRLEPEMVRERRPRARHDPGPRLVVDDPRARRRRPRLPPR